jgi:hypothetical protein
VRYITLQSTKLMDDEDRHSNANGTENARPMPGQRRFSGWWMTASWDEE